MLDTLLLVPSLHCNTSLHFTTLHFTTLIDTSLPLIYTSLLSHMPELLVECSFQMKAGIGLRYWTHKAGNHTDIVYSYTETDVSNVPNRKLRFRSACMTWLLCLAWIIICAAKVKRHFNHCLSNCHFNYQANFSFHFSCCGKPIKQFN